MIKLVVTSRQKELLNIIYEFVTNAGYPPTFEEMRERLGVSSNQSVIDLLEKLCRAALVRRNETAARGLAILPLGYEILGKPPLAAFLGVTSAGAPIQSIEISGEWQMVSKEISRLSEEMFILKIAGDSMINAGIDDGDVVLVQTKKEFVSGEIVYAQIGEEGTVKRFVSQDKPPYIFLKPENPKYKDILFTDSTRLKGKVVSVFKNNYWKAVK